MSRRLDGRQSKRRRQQRSSSPKYDKYARQKKPDFGADELIRFVREYQIERQPTILRLQKLAPLPGIGKSLQPVVQVPTEASYNDTSHSNEDSEPDDGFGDNYQDSDDDLDDEISSYVDNFKLADKLLDGMTSRYNTPNNGASGHRVGSRIQHQAHDGHPNARVLSQIYGLPKLRKLPPLERDELPGRPSAPPPSHTPKPASVSSDEEVDDEERSYIETC